MFDSLQSIAIRNHVKNNICISIENLYFLSKSEKNANIYVHNNEEMSGFFFELFPSEYKQKKKREIRLSIINMG
jgi:ribosome biogenesis protein Nip4